MKIIVILFNNYKNNILLLLLLHQKVHIFSVFTNTNKKNS